MRMSACACVYVCSSVCGCVRCLGFADVAWTGLQLIELNYIWRAFDLWHSVLELSYFDDSQLRRTTRNELRKRRRLGRCGGGRGGRGRRERGGRGGRGGRGRGEEEEEEKENEEEGEEEE